MPRFFTNNGIKKGSAPGSLIFVGKQKMTSTMIHQFSYENGSLEEGGQASIEEALDSLEEPKRHWINIDGLHDEKVVETFGSALKLDPLLLEDILDTTQRPKCDVYNDHMYIVLRMIRYDDMNDVTISEQFSMVIGENYLFTFQEIHGDFFEPVRERIRNEKSKIRNRSVDYLSYALLDTVVDNYIYAIEQFGEKIEQIDTEILAKPSKELLSQITYYKKEINYLRRVIRPVRELVFQLEKSEFMQDTDISYLKDLQDHLASAIESIETYRELLSDQLNVYHTSMSNKLNDSIRILTIFSVIFIPLTFLSGVYGMNFKYFPELNYKYSYPIFWLALITISTSMILYFKKKKWL